MGDPLSASPADTYMYDVRLKNKSRLPGRHVRTHSTSRIVIVEIHQNCFNGEGRKKPSSLAFLQCTQRIPLLWLVATTPPPEARRRPATPCTVRPNIGDNQHGGADAFGEVAVVVGGC